jgi:hypothetical protein
MLTKCLIGYRVQEPWEHRSNTKQSAFNKEANGRTEIFLKEKFCPKVKKDLISELGSKVDIYIDESDKQTVVFAYPRLFTNSAILPVIRLEIGVLAAWTPIEIANIEPYAAQHYPKFFDYKSTTVQTVAAERTFWEKATILHHEANRPVDSRMPMRYARHYYDLFRMALTPIKDLAFAQLELLQKVVDFKNKFYPRSWAEYEKAVQGTLKLVPPNYRLSELEADYNATKGMLFGEIPSFKEIIGFLGNLEREFNKL